ncbi:MAG: S9 family peptidase [Gemmatimonadota bacterium]|jgi:dipeptidyl aminopeptidase/acylaminoacyl peptidase
MRGLLLLSLAFAAGPAPFIHPRPAAAQDSPDASVRRALTLEDYYAVRSIEAPRISPDGDWVVYAVEIPVEADNGTIRELWLTRTDGSAEPVRVQTGEIRGAPSWTRDGHVAFTDGTGQRWLAGPASPTPVADERPEIDGLPSPDGTWRAVLRDVPTTPEAEAPMSDFERRHAERFEGAQFDWYPFVRDGQSFPLPDPAALPMQEIVLESADGDRSLQLTSLGLRPGNLSWRPDGRQILFTADEAVRDPLAYGRSDLFTVDLDGEGQVTRLTDDGFTYSGVAYSPDGGAISYVRSWGTDYIIERKLDHGGPRDLYVRPVEGGEPVNLTADFDLDPSSPRWAPDSRHLYFTAGLGGATHLFRVAADGGPVEQVTTGERRILSLDIDDAFERMTYLVGRFEAPSEIWSADIDGGNERQLTNVHAAFLDTVALSRAETVHYESFDGTPIEGFLLHPYGYDPEAPGADPWPLIVVNHGGPHSASGYGFSFKNQYFAAKGYFVFLPNFRSSTGYGDDFKWATWGGWGTLDGEDVLAGVDHLVERYPIDRDRVGTTGHSYGGILTNWLITRYPDRFAAAVSGAGASNWTSNYAHSDVARTKELEFFGRPWEPEAREIMIRQSPYLNSAGVQTPTLFVHGEVDYRVPLEGAIQLYTSLKKQRVPAELIIYEGMAHGIRGHWNVVHRMMNEMRWWETYLRPRRGTPASQGR